MRPSASPRERKASQTPIGGGSRASTSLMLCPWPVRWRSSCALMPAGLPSSWPDSPKIWGIWRRATRVGMRWSWAEKAALKASGDPGGQYGGALSTGASRLTPEPAGNTRLQTKAFQEAWGRVRIRGLALCRQRRPRGRSQQAPGGHPLVTAVRAGRALGKQRHFRGSMWAVLPARAHRAHCQAARRLSARHVAASSLVPAAPPAAASA